MNDISGQYFTVYIDTSIVAEVVKRLGCISCSREHKISTSCQDAVKVSQSFQCLVHQLLTLCETNQIAGRGEGRS